MDSSLLGSVAPPNVPPERVVDFDIYQPFGQEMDLHLAWMRLREACPFNVIWTPHNEGHWIALEPELISTVLMDSARFSNRIVLVPKSTAGEAYSELIPLSLDPPHHRPFRKILDKKLHGSAINPLEASIRQLTTSLIDGFVSYGRCNFVHDFAERLPLHVFMKLVDLPVEDLPKLKHLADQFTRPDGSITPAEASAQFKTYLVPKLAKRKEIAGDDLLSHIIAGWINDRPITEDEAANLASQVLVGGLDTVVNFMSFAMLTLASMPEMQQRITEDFSAIPDVTNELLRRLPIVTSGREVVRDVTVDGVTLAAGQVVMAPTVLFSLNAKINERPFELDEDRPLKKTIIFGAGRHNCPGQYLARLEINVLLEEWFRRIPRFHLAPGQQVRHHGGITAGTDPFVLEWA